jgi:hypothetical protein
MNPTHIAQEKNTSPSQGLGADTNHESMQLVFDCGHTEAS